MLHQKTLPEKYKKNILKKRKKQELLFFERFQIL